MTKSECVSWQIRICQFDTNNRFERSANFKAARFTSPILIGIFQRWFRWVCFQFKSVEIIFAVKLAVRIQLLSSRNVITRATFCNFCNFFLQLRTASWMAQNFNIAFKDIFVWILFCNFLQLFWFLSATFCRYCKKKRKIMIFEQSKWSFC